MAVSKCKLFASCSSRLFQEVAGGSFVFIGISCRCPEAPAPLSSPDGLVYLFPMADDKNPWITLSTTQIYSNPWIRVREDSVIRPDGKRGIYGVIEARTATAVLALDERQRLVLVGQYRYPVNEYSWEVVEGAAEDGETALEAAKRELEEEAGLQARSWRQLGKDIQISNCVSAERAYLFVAEGLTEVPRRPEGTEVLTVRSVCFSEAVEMVESSVIKDALSIVGILRLAREIKE